LDCKTLFLNYHDAVWLPVAPWVCRIVPLVIPTMVQPPHLTYVDRQGAEELCYEGSIPLAALRISIEALRQEIRNVIAAEGRNHDRWNRQHSPCPDRPEPDFLMQS